MDRPTSPEHRSFLWKSLQVVARVGSTLLFDLKTYHRENVPLQGPALLVSNHQSYLDPVVVAVQLRRPVSFMAKSELFVNPYFSWLIRNLHAFPVRQRAGDVGAIKETVQRLQEGKLLVVFPEGSRSEVDVVQPLERGIALVVRRANVPVIPVAISGSLRAWPKGKKLFRPHKICVVYGEPMILGQMKGEQIIATLHGRLQSLLDHARSLSTEASHVKDNAYRADGPAAALRA